MYVCLRDQLEAKVIISAWNVARTMVIIIATLRWFSFGIAILGE